MGSEPSSSRDIKTPSDTRKSLPLPSNEAAPNEDPCPAMGWIKMHRWGRDDDLQTVYDVMAYAVVIGISDTHVDIRQDNVEFQLIGYLSDWKHLLGETIRRELPIGEAWALRYEPVGVQVDVGKNNSAESRVPHFIGVVRDNYLYRTMRLARRVPPAFALPLTPLLSMDSEWNSGEWLQPGLFDRKRDLETLKFALTMHLFDSLTDIVADYTCLPEQTIVFSSLRVYNEGEVTR
jgi:hypothetical protein